MREMGREFAIELPGNENGGFAHGTASHVTRFSQWLSADNG